MRSNKTRELQKHRLWSTHEKSGAHHAERNELSGHSEEKEASFLPSCVLRRRVSHCQDQGWKEEYFAQEILCKYLIFLLVTCLPISSESCVGPHSNEQLRVKRCRVLETTPVYIEIEPGSSIKQSHHAHTAGLALKRKGPVEVQG